MEILYSDKDLAVCIKPIGMDSEQEVPAALTEQLGGLIFPIHRLDKAVSGVMVYARTKEAAAILSKQIQQGQFIKEYVAQVHGEVPESGDWQDLLFKDSRKNKVFVVKRQRTGVKPARLEFTRLTAGEISLVKIRLHTGRTHQIRAQFASRGFPLVGDHKYGARDDCTTPMLCSCRISFDYKGTQKDFTYLPSWAK